jgi:DNA-binding SARP family transcriptional activator
VHREVLMELLWPGADPGVATRNLHVLVSSLRHVLEPGARRGKFELLVREDEAYRLRVPPGGRVDVADFDAAIDVGSAALRRGSRLVAAEAFERALSAYAGDLLPEEGPADWIVYEREARRRAAVGAARQLAEILLGRGEPLAAAAVCERGLLIDHEDTPLWQLSADAHESAGEHAAAARARASRDRLLREPGPAPRQSASSL